MRVKTTPASLKKSDQISSEHGLANSQLVVIYMTYYPLLEENSELWLQQKKR